MPPRGLPITRPAQSFGDAFRLTLLTDDPVQAAAADRIGVDRIGLDIERAGKAGRQAGHDVRLSDHRIESLAAIGAALERADLFIRLNPVGPSTAREIETALRLGAKALMLPYFRTAGEVATFVRLADGRAHVTALLETAPAVLRIRDILAVPGVDEMMIGLNDLRLAFRVRSHFEVLASPLLDWIAGETHKAGLPLSVGGVARLDDASLPVSPDLVLAQYPRLGATGGWLSRSFLRGVGDERDFAAAIAAVRGRLTQWADAPPEALERARATLARRARETNRLSQ